MKMEYVKGSENNPESVKITKELDAPLGTTVCTVNADLLICGVNDFIADNKAIVHLALEEKKEILEFIKNERGKIIHKAKLKSLASWHDCGFNKFEDYFLPGDMVTKDLVDYFVNILPPVSCSSSYVQAGDAYDHRRDACGVCRATYITFTKKDGTWFFAGYCFKNGMENVVVCHNRLENAIFDVDYLIRFEEYKEENHLNES